MKNLGIVGSLSSLAVSMLDFRPLAMPITQTTRGSGVRNWRKAGDFDPCTNRHTGRPHEHKREIARRLRQANRKTA